MEPFLSANKGKVGGLSACSGCQKGSNILSTTKKLKSC